VERYAPQDIGPAMTIGTWRIAARSLLRDRTAAPGAPRTSWSGHAREKSHAESIW
jgi:hypothetical protein